MAGWFYFRSFDAFAHNDDFLYARCAEILVEEGRYQHVSQYGQLAASVASHCVWGALVCFPVGFSYDALHVSVGIASWFGAICLYLAICEMTGERNRDRLAWGALLAALTWVVNPYTYGLSFTFMTDVTAASFAAAGILGYVRGIHRASIGWLLFGAIGVSLATWSRQTHLCVIVLPLVALVGCRAHKYWGSVETDTVSSSILDFAVRLLVSVGIPVLSFVLFEMGWVVPGNDERVGIVDVDRYDAAWMRQSLLFAYGGGLLLGFVTLPLLPVLAIRSWDLAGARRWRCSAVLAVLFVWGGAYFASGGRAYLTQATGYILYNAHLGPVLLIDQNDPGRWSDIGGVLWPSFVWKLITIASVLNLGLMADRFCVAVRDVLTAWGQAADTDANKRMSARNPVIWIHVGLWVCLSSAVVGLQLYVEMIYDRYWMLCYPMLFVLLGAASQTRLRGLHETLEANSALSDGEKVSRLYRRSVWVSFLIAGLVFAISFVFVHDFLAWNDARYQQVQEWLADGLQPSDFDAGNGINGWYRSHEDVETQRRPGAESTFWRGLATHALSIGPHDGWTVVGKRTWNSWAVGKECELLVLRKDPED